LKAVRRTFLKEKEYGEELYCDVGTGYLGHIKRWKNYCIAEWWQRCSPAEHQEQVVRKLLKGSLAAVSL